MMPTGGIRGAGALAYSHRRSPGAQEAALDAAEAAPRGGTADLAAQAAHDAFWEHDDRIMAAPCTTMADLAIKTKIMQLRTDSDGPYPDYATRLASDTIAIAAQPVVAVGFAAALLELVGKVDCRHLRDRPAWTAGRPHGRPSRSWRICQRG